MKCSPSRAMRVTGASLAAAAGCLCLGAARIPTLFHPGGGFARWIENVPAGSAVESALFRAMQLPGGEFLVRRPPRETIPALSELQKSDHASALLSLRAIEEEQGLDFAAAERDWNSWADAANDRLGAHLDLADFYERRLQAQPELAALEWAGSAPEEAGERFTAVEQQRSWIAFERALKVIDEYALGRAESERIYAAWVKRYPLQPVVRMRRLDFFLAGKDFSKAQAEIAEYQTSFPHDRVFPVKAEADLAVCRGNAKDGLAVYDSRFEPLWPPELIQNYFRLVLQSHQQRAFRDTVRARLEANSDDLKDAARLFYLQQQQGQLDAAKTVLTNYREKKEERGAAWSPEELSTLEKLFEAVQDFPEAAQYAFALAAQHANPSEEREGIVSLARILLTAPEQPLRVGAGDLSLYRDIATMDRGPGYLNGILSLFLNSQAPENEYSRENQLAVPYFHRARAAELLADIDKRFPDEPSRPLLHAKLMEAYATYGDSSAVISEGTRILSDYPHFAGRVRVALELADAYQRTSQVEKEFALYQALLKELAAQAEGVPLGTTDSNYSKPVTQDGLTPSDALPVTQPGGDTTSSGSAETASETDATNRFATLRQGPRSADYAQVLDRYLGRLVALQRLPDALAVLRGELDRNPQDPGLYERLADFLEQNRLNAHIEEVYQRAIGQFQNTGWYAKLARFYLRQRRSADYRALMHTVADTFSGTELESSLQQAPAPDRSLAFEVDKYASERFPHELGFVRRLLAQNEIAKDQAAVETLLWAHWTESADLRDRLFQLLSQTNRLNSTLSQLRQQSPEVDRADWSGLVQRNPAAARFWVDACLWQSHYEQAAEAADTLAASYPADTVVGAQASSLHRSLAYFHPEETDRAVAVEKRLLDSQPGDLDTLSRIGDIYADRQRFQDAAPFWLKMADIRPGEANGYLQSATVFWDYFDFADARTQLQRGQTRLHDPTLFAYQEGAIEESLGEVPAATRLYVEGSTAEHPSLESKERLLTLARRPASQALVESATANLLREEAPNASAIQLRAAILDAEHRKDQLARELQQLVSRTTSFDVLDTVSDAARKENLSEIQEDSLRRQVALTTDPVHGLELRYQLVDLIGPRNSTAAAQQIDAIYRENPKILGVVRSTVDYDWNHERRRQSVAVLLDSATVAYPELGTRFQLEAAGKLTQVGDYERSRTLLGALLKDNPLDARYESAMADTLARAGDQVALDTFYRAQLDLIKRSSLPRPEKDQRIAQLRRGIIAADTVLAKFDGATDQYIELIRAYPDDAGLVQEAALFAVSHKSRDRLFAYFQKAVADSPRDVRWSVVLARLAAAAEDDALAIDAYAKALRIAPERQDLYVAAADVDEHLGRLEDAIVLDRKLYTLTYRDPKWMLKAAELSARERKQSDATSALETALIEGRPPKPAYFFAAAAHLEDWGMLDAAQKYADRGVDLAAADLLVGEQDGAATYARIMTRHRKTQEAFALLKKARADAAQLSLSTVAQQIVQEGPGAVTDVEWRRQRQEQRSAAATAGFAHALQAMGEVAAACYTPEEKSQLATLLGDNAGMADKAELENVYLPAAKAAQIAPLIEAMEWSLVLKRKAAGEFQADGWLQLEKHRGQMAFAAAQLEKLAPGFRRASAERAWRAAAAAWHDAGDTAGELRAMEHLSALANIQGEELSRFYALLLSQRPQALIDRARANDSAAQYLVRNGSAQQAMAAIDARSSNLPSVWKSAYTGLTGLFVRDQRPAVKAAFEDALAGDATIAQRVAHPADRQRQLAGDIWFYYGSRYADYLDEANDPRREDYEESALEAAPGSPAAYLQLAEYSARRRRDPSALIDYLHSLDLNPDQPAVVNQIAEIEWKDNRQSEALSAWSKAVNLLAAEMDARHFPETFWGDFAQVLKSVSAAGQFDTVQNQVDAMLRVYLKRNGAYRSEPLLEAAYRAHGKSVDWLLDISAASTDQQALLWSILPQAWSEQGHWIEKSQLSRIDAKLLELAEARHETAAEAYDGGIDAARRRLVEALLDEGKLAEARQALGAIPLSRLDASDWLPVALRLGDADGSLSQMIGRWKSQTDAGPALNDLRNAAAELSQNGRRAVLRFVYETAIARRDLAAVNFLGLAAIHLDENDAAGAMQLLERLILVSTSMYADEDAAARLLENRHRSAEAIRFLGPLSSSNPWNANYRMRLAKAMLASDPHPAQAIAELSAVAADPTALYVDRVEAARALKGHGAAVADAGELKALSSPGCPSAQSVSQPLYVASRIEAASCSGSLQSKEQLLGEALAAAPDDSALRIQYVFAAFAAHDDARAVTAAVPYFPGNYYSPPAGADAASSFSELAGDAPEVNSGTLAGLKLADAARLVSLVEAACEHRGDFAQALTVLSQGVAVVHDDKLRAPLEQRQDAVRKVVARSAANDARVPRITSAMEQDRVVKPRLLPDMPAPEDPEREEQP